MAVDPDSDRLSENLTTAEHENISQAVEMLLRFDQLKRRGLSADEMAETMAISGFRPPGGGEWTADTITRVAGLVGSAAENRPPQQLHPLRPRSTATEDVGSADVARTPAARQVGTSGQRAGAAALGGQTLVTRQGDTPSADAHRFEGDDYSDESYFDDSDGSYVGPLPGVEEESPWLGSRALALGLIVLMALAVTAFGVVAIAERNQADEEAGTSEDESGTGDEVLVASPTSVVTPPGVPPTGEAPDPADLMSIRVEPEAAAVDGDGPPAATATVKADGLLHLEGAFPSQSEADGFIEGLAKVFGRDNIVESYTIDPAAPLPTVSDVSLDKPVLFETGTATIDPSYIPFLEACGDVLRLNPQITMSITAFTDSVGDEDFNLDLSQRRAQAIYDFYRDLDIDDTQLLSVGYGEADPVGDNTTEAGREQNRRAMLQLLDVMADQTNTDSE